MYLIKSLGEIDLPGGCALCLGNFDGLHLGHRLIISTLKKEAEAAGLKTVIFTFYPHPLRFFGKNIRLLSTPRKRLELFQTQDVDYLVDAPFDQRLASLPPEEFFRKIAAAKAKAKIAVVGEDYRFGAGKSGDIRLMKDLGERFGVKCVFVKKLRDASGMEISSTRIRELILSGEVSAAAKLLGRHYSLEGPVLRGDGKGKEFGFPTINMEVKNEIIPASGVYVSKTHVRGREYSSMTYIGGRPTVSDKGPIRVETNIFDFDEEVYGEFAEIFFLEYIRGDVKFPNIEALKEQMAKDKERAKIFFQKRPDL